MKIEEYIASGIIEAYIFDQLSALERADVQRMSIKYPEVNLAISEAEETFLAFTEKGSIAPPATVKAKLFNQLGIANQIDAKAANETKIVPISDHGPTNNGFYAYISAAASIIAILGIVLSLYYRGQWQESESRISQLLTQNETLAQQYNVVKNQADQYAYNVDILRQPGIETVAMKGLDISPDAYATVHWNKKSNEVFLNAKKMPTNPEAFQYQLWAIVDGAPVDMGLFDVAGDMTSLLKMKTAENASAFAVTLEPRGGSVNPTMEQMYVIGQI